MKKSENYFQKSRNFTCPLPKIWRTTKKTYINDNGYACFRDSDKLVHRWVMEKRLGRRLNYQEVVHHIDGDKLNNLPENLMLFTSQEEHDLYHRGNLKNYGSWYETVPEYAKRY